MGRWCSWLKRHALGKSLCESDCKSNGHPSFAMRPRRMGGLFVFGIRLRGYECYFRVASVEGPSRIPLKRNLKVAWGWPRKVTSGP